MIGKLKGIVDACFQDYVIIDVNGVGYLVYCSGITLNQLHINESCNIFIVTHVREDHIHLYGFMTQIEKEFFNLLQSVNGIGSRMALSILTVLTPEKIQVAILQKNKEVFKAVSGVGTKLAERILVELKGKIKSEFPIQNIEGENLSCFYKSDIAEDAISALANLGMNKFAAQNMIYKLISSKPDINLDELIRLALKEKAG